MRARALLPLVVAGAVLVGCATAQPPPVGVVQSPVPPVSADPALTALLPAELAATGALRIAVPAESGAEQELGEAIARRLGLQVVPDGVSATVLPRALWERRHDLGINPNPLAGPPAGAAEVPWLESRTAVVTRPGNPDRIEPTTLCGHRVGVVAGSLQHADVRERDLHCADNRHRAITLVPVAGAADATRRMLAAELDAFVADGPAAGRAVVLGQGRLEIPGTPYGTGTGAIIAPATVAPAIRATLDSLVADGTYDAILARWLLTGLAVPR